jgi:hypothetical protein
MRCFRQSLAILLALLATYHFGCLVMSWVARYHPFDEASAFTLPALCLAFFCLHLRELPHLHSGLAYVLSCATIACRLLTSRSLLQCGCSGGGCLSLPVLLARCPSACLCRRRSERVHLAGHAGEPRAARMWRWAQPADSSLRTTVAPSAHRNTRATAHRGGLCR